MRLCGSPEVSIEVSSSASRWQVVAYLLTVDWKDVGSLISYGSATCWTCPIGERITRQIHMHALCEDVTDGLGLAFNLYSDLYYPANVESNLTVTFHYTANFTLSVPILAHGEPSHDMIVV